MLYRIRTIQTTLPPLRNRDGDLKLLALHYLSKIAERYGVENKAISPDFIDTLRHYAWPGNVRELINALETALSNAGPESTLFSRHLPQNIRLHAIQQTLDKAPRTVPVGGAVAAVSGSWQKPLTTFKAFRKAAVSTVEREYLCTLLDQTQKSLEKSLDISGLSRSRFYDLLKQHNLSL